MLGENMMKNYIKPDIKVKEMDISSCICASVTGEDVPKVDTYGDISEGDAADAMSKGNITHYGVWD